MGSSFDGPLRQACCLDATGFTGLGTLKAEAMREGAVFCGAMSKEFELVSEDNSEGLQVLGNFPWVEITFVCV